MRSESPKPVDPGMRKPGTAGVWVEKVGEASFDAGALVAEGGRLARGLELGREADTVFFGLDFVAGEGGAFFFSFDDAGGDGVDVEEIVGFAVAGFQGEFADGDAAGGVDVGFVAGLDEPAGVGEEPVNGLAGAVFGGDGHGRKGEYSAGGDCEGGLVFRWERGQV